MTREDLNREFDNRKVLYYDGGLCLFQADDAIALVQRAAEATIPILGIDALDLRPGRTTSSIENIADFSDAVAAGDGCWLEAEAFIRARRDLGLVFEVILGVHDDPSA